MDARVNDLLAGCPDARSAVATFFDALLKPRKDRVLSAQIQAVRQLECWELALRLAEIARERHPDNAFLLGHEAHCLIQLDRNAEAVARIDAFFQRVPTSRLSEQNLRYLGVYRSSAFEHLGDLDEAERSLEGLPMVANVVEQWITLKYLRDDFDEVIRLGERYNPAKPESRLQWARSLSKLERYDEARRVLESVVERSSEARELFLTLVTRGTQAGSDKRVAVVHGRHPAGRGMFNFLRAVRLDPIEFGEATKMAIQATGQLNPHPIAILNELFRCVRAVVVVLTGDDEAKLKAEFLKDDDGPEERQMTPQPRPNVLFEGGLAYGLYPTRTVLVQLGYIRPFSDVTGLHVVKLDSAAARQDLVERLRLAGCAVDSLEGKTQWLSDSFFAVPT